MISAESATIQPIIAARPLMISIARGSLNATMASVNMDMSSPSGAASAMEPSAGSIAALNAAGAATSSVDASTGAASSVVVVVVVSPSARTRRETPRRAERVAARAERPATAETLTVEAERANIVMWWRWWACVCVRGSASGNASIRAEARFARKREAHSARE